MSTAVITRVRKSMVEAPWQLWANQFLAIVRIEVKKNLWMRRSIWIYLLAFVPSLIFGAQALLTPVGAHPTISEETTIFAHVFQIFYLRVAIFFGCMGLFTWLFRGEVVEKSLHYYFLSPARRQILVLAKFVAGLLTTSLMFGGAVLLCFVFAYGQYGKVGQDFVFNGLGLGQLTSYLFVTVLACLGFGSLFLALSLVFKNPIIPGFVVLLWETFHAVAPSLLQKLSVSFYLKQLCPVTIPAEGIMALFTVIAEPVSPWLAVPGLMLLSLAILIFACARIRRTEISYLAD